MFKGFILTTNDIPFFSINYPMFNKFQIGFETKNTLWHPKPEGREYHGHFTNQTKTKTKIKYLNNSKISLNTYINKILEFNIRFSLM